MKPTAPSPESSAKASAATKSVPEPVLRAVAEVRPEDAMRFYKAILGHEPTVDPQAPDLLPRMHETDPPARGWADEMSRSVRDDLARTLGKQFNIRFEGRPSWRKLMDAMTGEAGRRLEEARRRLQSRPPQRPAAKQGPSEQPRKAA